MSRVTEASCGYLLSIDSSSLGSGSLIPTNKGFRLNISLCLEIRLPGDRTNIENCHISKTHCRLVMCICVHICVYVCAHVCMRVCVCAYGIVFAKSMLFQVFKLLDILVDT